MIDNSTQRTILIAEDEQLLAETLSMSLVNAGFQTIIAQNGYEALRAIQENSIDLILLDLMMPEMDGFTFLKEFKKTNPKNDIPIIILTNVSDTVQIMEMFEHGMDASKHSVTSSEQSFSSAERHGIKKYLEVRLQNTVYEFLIKSQWDLHDIIGIINHKFTQQSPLK